MARRRAWGAAVHVAALALAATGAGCSDDDDSPPATMVFVDDDAAPGGDGTLEHPYRTVGKALAHPGVLTVALAAGTYPVPASWTFGPALTMMGYQAQAEPPVLEVEGADAERIEWSSAGTLWLRQLAFASPLDFDGDTVELQQVSVSGVVGPGLHFHDATARLYGVEVDQITEVAEQIGSGDGVAVDGGELTWHQGSILEAPDRALVLRGGTAALHGLTLSGGDRAPLTVSEQAEVTAAGLNVGSANMAVYVGEATLRLEQSTIHDGQTYGILGGPQGIVEVSDSTFVDCPQGHVVVLGSDASLTLERNSFDGAVGEGCVSATGTDGAVRIRDNTLTRCAGSGISLYEISDAVVEGNQLSDILPHPMFAEIADGISLLDTSGTQIIDNRVVDFPGVGVALLRSSADIEDNEIGPGGGPGISLVEPGPDRCRVADNQITEATMAGVIALDGATADIEGNHIAATVYSSSDGLGDGIAFGVYADVSISNNTLTGNNANGIVFLDGALGEIAGNTITNNSYYGIREFCVGDGSDVTIGSNDIADNGYGPTNLCSP